MDVLLYDFFYYYSERYLGPKPLLRKRYLYELIETIRHNNTDLKKRYLGPRPLLRKRYYSELIETIWHNNADLKKVTHPRLTKMTAECSVRGKR